MALFMSYPTIAAATSNEDRMLGSVPDDVESTLILVANSFNFLQPCEI